MAKGDGSGGMSGSAVGLMEAGSGCSKIDDDVLPYSQDMGAWREGG